VTLTEEYARCAEWLGFDLATLGEISLAAFDASFLAWPERVALRDGAAREIALLLDEAHSPTDRPSPGAMV